MEKKIRTKAHVKILLEISLPDVWDDNCSLSQVFKQSENSARNIIAQKISSSLKDVKIIGKPEVLAVLAEE